MPLYTDPATGKKIRSQEPLSDAELEEAFGGTATTTTPTTHDWKGDVLRALPRTTGALAAMPYGAELGAPLGPLGVVGGAAVTGALGAMAPEFALGLGQRALGLPQGRQPLLPRVAQAGREAFTGGLISEIGGPAVSKGFEAVGQAGEGLMSRLGMRNPFGIARGPGEEMAARMAGTRGAAGVVAKAARRQTSEITQAGQQILDDLGDTETRRTVTRKATHAMRQAFRDLLTRGVRKGAEGYPDAGPLVERLPSRLGKLGYGVAVRAGETSERIEETIRHTIDEAGVAERLAAHPGAYEELAQRQGREVADQARRQWWTATLFDATGTQGLQKGVLDGAKVAEKFDALGTAKQRELFADALPQVTRFVETVRGMPLGGAVPETVAPLNWKWLTERGGVLGALLGRGSAQQAMAGAATGAAGALAWPAVPFVAAKLLTSPQGAEFMTRAVMQAARVAPTAIRAGAQAAATQVDPLGQLMTPTKPPPPPKVPDHVQVPP